MLNGLEEGAKPVIGGGKKWSCWQWYLFTPTVFENVTNDMTIAVKKYLVLFFQ